MEPSVDAAPDARPRPRNRTRLLAVVAVGVAVLAALGIRAVASGDESAASEVTLDDLLAQRVVAILEDSSHEDHAEHGHYFDEDEGGVLCAAEPFGYEPADADSISQVEVVYTQHMCGVVVRHFPWPQNVRAAGPIIVELSDPPEVIVPGSGTEAEVRAAFPEEHHEAALRPGVFQDPAISEQLRERFETALAG